MPKNTVRCSLCDLPHTQNRPIVNGLRSGGHICETCAKWAVQLFEKERRELSKEPPIPCKGVAIDNIDGGYYDCEYPFPTHCEDCIVNGGDVDPRKEPLGVD
jgi:hypothetical protein